MLAPKLHVIRHPKNVDYSSVIAEIFLGDLISFISYFWLRVRNLQSYENHARIPMYVTPSLLYGNL